MANEKRLIDANALRKRMFSYYSCVDENSSKEYYKGETLMSYEVADMIEDCIDNAPTVDAVEVVHAKWVSVIDYGGFCVGFCSVCDADQKARNATALRAHHRHCRWCGARMDGDGNV